VTSRKLNAVSFKAAHMLKKWCKACNSTKHGIGAAGYWLLQTHFFRAQAAALWYMVHNGAKHCKCIHHQNQQDYNLTPKILLQ